MSLLEKAKAIELKPRAGVGEFLMEEIELALAWLRYEVRDRQVSNATGTSHGNVPTWAMARIRSAVRSGHITIQWRGEK